jgi:hypothetical protein
MLLCSIKIEESRVSAIGIMTSYRLVEGRASSTASRLVVGPTQPPTKWLLGALSLGMK